MSLTREIVTVQLGNYSNFIGAHLWNIQDSRFVFENPDKTFKPNINHDVLFREGQSLHGVVTYSPRLIAYDLKGCLGGELLMNDLYDGAVDPIKEHLSKTSLSDKIKTRDLSWNRNAVRVLADENSWQRNIDRFDPPEESEEELSNQLQNDAGPVPHSSCNGRSERQEPNSNGTDSHLKKCRLNMSMWSDILSTRLHPRSFNVITEYLHGSDYWLDSTPNVDEQKLNFSLFEQGQQLFNSEKYQDDWEDRLHFFAEECDYLQGFQILFDSPNAFSGVALSVMKNLQDDFSKKITWTVPVCPVRLYPPSHPQSHHDKSTILLNHVITWGAIAQDYGSIVLPLSLAHQPWSRKSCSRDLPYLTNDWSDVSQSSALLAACLDTMTLPARKLERASSLVDMSSLLVQLSRKFISTSCALPVPIQEGGSILSLLDEELPFHRNLTPFINHHNEFDQISSNVTSQFLSVQGLTSAYLPKPSEMRQRFSSTNESISSILQLYLREMYPTTLSQMHVVDSPLKLTKTLPLSFSNSKIPSASDQQPKSSACNGQQWFDNIASSCLLQAGPSISAGLRSLLNELESSDVKRLFAKLSPTIHTDDLHSGIETFREALSCYSDD